jgi:phage terminase large subunit-like protein
MAASNAILVRDAAGNKKIDKSKSTLKIDPLIAAIMAAFEVTETSVSTTHFDVQAIIG